MLYYSALWRVVVRLRLRLGLGLGLRLLLFPSPKRQTIMRRAVWVQSPRRRISKIKTIKRTVALAAVVPKMALEWVARRQSCVACYESTKTRARCHLPWQHHQYHHHHRL